MSYHDKRNPDTGGAGASENVSGWNVSEVKPQSGDNQEQLQAELASVRRHLEHRAQTNSIIARWRDELRHKIERNQLRHELIGLGADEYDQLVAEVAEYKRLCAALNWSPSGRRRR